MTTSSTKFTPAVLLHPEIRDVLIDIGKTLPFENFGQLFDEQPKSIAAFTDYSGDNPQSRYETFVAYLVHWNHLQPLVNRLAHLRERAGGRTPSYKGRKDRLKRDIVQEWLSAFHVHPGLCVAICFDKDAAAFRRTAADRTSLKDSFTRMGLKLKPNGTERLIRAMAFLAVVGHLFRSRDRFVWVSDADAILEGTIGKHLPTALGALADQVVGKRLAAFGYCKPLSLDHEMLLSLPDLVAGALASSVPSPLVNGGMVPPDADAALILNELASFPDPRNTARRGTRILPIVIKADRESEMLRPCVVRLTQAARKPAV